VTPFKPAESSSTQNINKIGGTRSESRVKMSKMRQTVASRLKASQNTCAMLTTFNEINMG
jgi:2-oxoglutarate dehydrogenase E2 component (dihydrolipoamide succinyltransferase)